MTNISRKIFLDCGGWKGTYAREITEIYPDALVYSFEPNPELFHYFDNIKNCTLIKKGIWICDGKKKFI
jgi:hypothetical protein